MQGLWRLASPARRSCPDRGSATPGSRPVKQKAVARMPLERRIATLLAFVRTLERLLKATCLFTDLAARPARKAPALCLARGRDFR